MKPKKFLSLVCLTGIAFSSACKQSATESVENSESNVSAENSSNEPDERLTTQAFAKKLADLKFHQLKGDKMETAAFTQAADYYLLYFSASW